MMEATAPPLEAPESKLKLDKFTDGPVTCLRLAGTIDEHFDGKKLALTVKAETLILDLGGVRKISSFGIREWVDFVGVAGEHVRDLYLVECSPKVVDQLNMVANFAGKGNVFSFYAPYRCDYCDAERRVLLQVDRDFDAIRAQKPPERACQTCGHPEYFDEDAPTFLSYVAQQARFELPPPVAAFLSAKLSYEVSESARRFRAEKHVEGRWTHLKLSGDLDTSFPRDKIAEGLEGVVVIDVSAVGKIDPAGAAGWRSFLAAASPVCEKMFLSGCPPVFLERLARAEDLGRAQIVSFTMPYHCQQCGTTASHLVDVAQNFDVLKFATPPEVPCPDCGGKTTCAASEALLAHLAALPRPDVSPELDRFIRAARERRPTAPVAVAQPPPRSGFPMMLVAVAAAALAAAAVALFFVLPQNRAPQVDSLRLVRASAPSRPDWAPKDARAFAACSETSCVAVSGLADDEAAGRAEALDAAVEHFAHNVALRSAKAQVDVLAAQRQRLLGAPGAETQARRHRIAEAVRRTGAAPAQPSATYVEEYEGKKTIVFVKIDPGARELASLAERWQAARDVLGARAVTAYPGLAWRWPDVVEGAFLDSVGPGPLRDAGVSPHDVVLEVDGKRIASADALANELDAEIPRLKKEGGALKLLVQTGDGEPRAFTVPVPRQAETPRTVDHEARPALVPVGTGVNIWDRTGGGKVRDDPND
jgi:anti-anti-sigma regulatory factor/DNA-directed RNA polymerase subunit RPC12/RpoP